MKIVHNHYWKILAVAVAVVLLVWAGFIWTNSQRVAHQQTVAAQDSITNHTQTLNEIEKAVNELKANNAADHQQTVEYINCVLVGVTNSTSQNQALAVYQTCLATEGIN